MKPLRLAGIGCGGRTLTYFRLAAAQPEKYQVVAAADPNNTRVEKARKISGNPEFRGFGDHHEILSQPKLADVMVIGTQDAAHLEHAVAAMEQGYDLLLEKPIATTLEDVLAVERRALELNRKVVVCHVLRYTPFYKTVKEIVESGELGEIVNLNATEGIGAWHFGHSYVRGHWAVVEKSSPTILAKSCHDMDIISWLVNRPCESVSSAGGLHYFHKGNCPEGAPPRCTDGCPVGDTCPYNCLLYTTKHRHWLYPFDGGPDAPEEDIVAWLRESPWGRCVYQCDNTALDHQTVNLAFAGGITATFTMTAFDGGRSIEIYGTKARLRGGDAINRLTGSEIAIEYHHGEKETQHVKVKHPEAGDSGHGGGDFGLMQELYSEMGQLAPDLMKTSISASTESHIMAFAAEASRLEERVVRLSELAQPAKTSASRLEE